MFVTVAAGVTIAYFESKLPAGTPVIRVMPNAPALVGAGVSALAKGRFATDPQLKEVSALFDSVGGVLTVPESQLDAVTAVSGSGSGVLLPDGRGARRRRCRGRAEPSVATDLAVQTMAGSAAMLLERMDADRRPAAGQGRLGAGSLPDTTAAQLRATVTSPGGTTAAGLRELERGGLRVGRRRGRPGRKKTL